MSGALKKGSKKNDKGPEEIAIPSWGKNEDTLVYLCEWMDSDHSNRGSREKGPFNKYVTL